jgi:hypothetical protein
MPIVKTNRGHEKVHVSNLNELSVNVDGLEGLQTTTNTKLTSIDNKITVGQDVKVTGSALQQVLLYGRNNDGTLHPLESVGDRLLVDVLELAASGRITTSTALSSSQVCGYDNVTSQFKTLNVDSDGKLLRSEASNRSSEVSIVSGVVVATSTQIGSDINISTAKTIIIYGSATGNQNFLLEHSSDGTNWFLHSDVSPTAHGAVYHYNVKVEDGLQYYRLINSYNNEYTLNYIKL